MANPDDHSQRGGGFISFVLCVSLLVSSAIYLTRLNNYIENGADGLSAPGDPTCVPELLPANSTLICVNVTQWKTYAILGIIPGSLYTLLILSQVFCNRILASETNEGVSCDRRVSKRRIFAYCIILILSIFLSLIPIYLVVNLFRTYAIYATLSTLSKPAMAMFVICILELLGLILFITCVVPVILGAACCAMCCFCWDRRGLERASADDVEQKTAMKPVQ